MSQYHLRIVGGHMPPFFEASCVPNGSWIQQLPANCDPGVEMLVLVTLLQQAKLNGTVVYYQDNQSVDTVIRGEADISGVTMSTKFFDLHHNDTVLMTSPIMATDLMLITLPLQDSREKTRGVLYTIFSWKDWVVYLTFNAFCFGLILLIKQAGMSPDSVKNCAAWFFVILSGLFTNMLAVEFALPVESSSPFDSVNHLIEQLKANSCMWHTPPAVAENMDIYEGNEMYGDINWDELLRVYEKVNPPVMVPGRTYCVCKNTKHLMKAYRTYPDKCHVMIDWEMVEPLYRTTGSQLGVNFLFTPLRTYSYYGYFYRKSLPETVKNRLSEASSQPGMARYYEKILHDRLVSDLKPSGNKGKEENQQYRQLTLLHVFDVFIAYGSLMVTALLLFAVWEKFRTAYIAKQPHGLKS